MDNLVYFGVIGVIGIIIYVSYRYSNLTVKKISAESQRKLVTAYALVIKFVKKYIN